MSISEFAIEYDESIAWFFVTMAVIRLAISKPKQIVNKSFKTVHAKNTNARLIIETILRANCSLDF